MGDTTGELSLKAGSVRNRHISTAANDIIDCDKIQQLIHADTDFGIDFASAPATKTKFVWQAPAAGTVRGFHAVLNVGGTASASSTFDLKKNGTTVLSGVVTFAAADTDAVAKDGTISVPSFVAGDIFTMVLTMSDATGASGPYAWAWFELTTVPAS